LERLVAASQGERAPQPQPEQGSPRRPHQLRVRGDPLSRPRPRPSPLAVSDLRHEDPPVHSGCLYIPEL